MNCLKCGNSTGIETGVSGEKGRTTHQWQCRRCGAWMATRGKRAWQGKRTPPELYQGLMKLVPEGVLVVMESMESQ